jgi:ATP-dependent DNA ligase
MTIELHKGKLVQKAPEIKDIAKFQDGEHWMEPKLDGYRATIHIEEDGVKVMSSSMKPMTGIAVAVEEAVKGLPVGTIIDGEFVYPIEFHDGYVIKSDFEKVSQLMRCLPAKAVARQKTFGPISFCMFDALQFGEKELVKESQRRRRRVVEALLKTIASPLVLTTPLWPVDKKYIDIIGAKGGEGAMIKNQNAIYQPGKKVVGAWYKFKFATTADVVIMGYQPPTKEYNGNHMSTHQYWYDEDRKVNILTSGGRPKKDDYPKISENLTPVTKYFSFGWIGTVDYGQYENGKLVYRGTCSGMTDDMRREFSNNGKDYIGRVMEIKHNGISSDNGFRHPNFLRLRDEADKAAVDCIWDEEVA